MKKHLALTCIAYLYFGVGLTVENIGIKAGLGLWATLGIFISSLVFFVIIIFTSMEEIKKKLFEKESKDENANA